MKMPKNTGKTQIAPSVKRMDNKSLAINLYFRGFSFPDIHGKLKENGGKTPALPVVENWIKEHLKILKDTRPDVVESFKFVELEKVNRLENEYWRAWEKSSSVQVTVKEVFKVPERKPGTRVRRKNVEGDLISTIRETKTLTGEARYLQGVQWCVEQRIQLLGVEAPRKNEFGNDENADALKEAAANLEIGAPRKVLFKIARTAS